MAGHADRVITCAVWSVAAVTMAGRCSRLFASIAEMLTLSLSAPFTFSPLARRSCWAALVVVAIVSMLLGGYLFLRQWAQNPAVPFLATEAGAKWILVDEPFRLTRRRSRQREVQFRRVLQVNQPYRQAILTVRAFKLAAVLVDGRLVHQPRTDFELWKEPLQVDLAPHLPPGEHTVVIFAANENGPPALLAHCAELDLQTDASWEASTDGQTFAPVALAAEKKPPELSRQFDTTLQAMASHGVLFTLLFVGGAALALVASGWRERRAWPRSLPSAPELWRYGLLAAWGILGANNLLRIPPHVGFDASGHVDYIQYVATTGQIPLAPEGWQMFQSPLYYLLSAPLFSMLKPLFSAPDLIRLLCVVPLLAGAAQVEICHRTLKRLFPERADVQIVGMLVGGLLPMNLYLAQGLGNESLNAALGGMFLACLLILVADPSARLTSRRALWLGILLGLALLAKVTSVLLLPLALAAFAWSGRREPRPWLASARATGVFLAATVLVAGWYYARNWIALGRPFIGGWDPGRSIVWWQDPGFRVLEHFTSFGTALIQPIHAATSGIWDAIYSTAWCDGYLSMMVEYDVRPPWNYGLLLACAGLSALPCMWILLGCLSPALRSARHWAAPTMLSLLACGVFLLAMVWLFASLPIYSTGKATYMSSATVCLAVLAAAGYELLSRQRLLRAAMVGGLVVWVVAAYGGYFVL